MDASERRREIMQLLSDRRHVKIEDLARRFGVSARTISRDLVRISQVMPIYDRPGRSGGIYVSGNFRLTQVQLRREEADALRRLLALGEAAGALPDDLAAVWGLLARSVVP